MLASSARCKHSLYPHDSCCAGSFAAAALLQLVLAPLQADVHDTAVSRALNPLNCLTALTSIA
jgi:hypothetical protein